MFQSPQEAANAEWAKLGEKYGFDYMSVSPCPGKDQQWISAEFETK